MRGNMNTTIKSCMKALQKGSASKINVANVRTSVEMDMMLLGFLFFILNPEQKETVSKLHT